MKKNIGNLDRMIRIMIAALLVGLFIFGFIDGMWTIIFMILAGILLLTSAMNFCPLYSIFRLSTNNKS